MNSDEPIALVFKTKDYDKFKLISENREPDHVKALIASFKNRLVPNAILCNVKYEIIDGQNRYLALKQLGEPILYYCIGGLDIYDVASLNSYGKNWGSEDYIKMWARLGKQEYQKILDFHDEYSDFSLSCVLTILQDGRRFTTNGYMFTDDSVSGTQRNQSVGTLKKGTFVVKDIEHAHYVARCIMEYKPYCRPGLQIYKQQSFVTAMTMLLRKKNFDNSELVRKAGSFPSLFFRCVNAKQYIQMLEDLWNYRRSKKIRFEY